MNGEKSKSATEIAEGLPPTPIDDDDHAELAERDFRVNEPSAMQVFFAWEKLRVVFNVLLTVIVLAIMGFSAFDFFPNLIEVAILANLIFCAGPVAEHYFYVVTRLRLASRYAAFLFGCFLGVFSTVRVVHQITNHLPVFQGFPGP